MNKLIKVSVKDLIAHPAQPPTRTRDTTDLQQSILAEGLHRPLDVIKTDDGYVLIGGYRRRSACIALVDAGHKQFAEVDAMLHDDMTIGSPETYRFMWSDNLASPTTKTELLFTIQVFSDQVGELDLYVAATDMGVNKTVASLLAKLVRYDKDDRISGRLLEEMQRHERTGKGLSWTAWKNGAAQTIAWWAERLDGQKSMTVTAIQDARSAQKDDVIQASLLPEANIDEVTELIPGIMQAMTKVFAAARNGMTENDKADLSVAFEPIASLTVKIASYLGES